MLPPEIAKQIHLLDIRTNRVVDEITGGAYRSVFKGRGIEFDEVREYTPEDDVRDIDWNVSARMGSPYIKKYIEERELTVLLLVDVSASGAFGSAEKTKRRTAAELAALLAFSAGRNGDKVGLMMFSDRIELYVPPKSGRRHTLRLIREMLAFEPASPGTDIALALRETAQMLKKKSVIFLISDLISEESFEASLKILNRKHDCIALQIFDPVEHRWPCSAPVVVERLLMNDDLGCRLQRRFDEIAAVKFRPRNRHKNISWQNLAGIVLDPSGRPVPQKSPMSDQQISQYRFK